MKFKLKLSLARLYSDSVYYDRAREFNDPNFGISESCTKKNALNKLARMSRVRHNAKSIESRYNSFKIFTKLFETFCPLHESPRHFEMVKQLISILFCGYRRRMEIQYCRSVKNESRNLYSPGAEVPQRVIREGKSLRISVRWESYILTQERLARVQAHRGKNSGPPRKPGYFAFERSILIAYLLLHSIIRSVIYHRGS